MSKIHSISFQSDGGRTGFSITGGEVVIVAGPNGTGKSAFLAEIYRALGVEVATYLPGHRQINFNGSWDASTIGVENIYQQLFQNSNHFNRHKNTWAEEQFKTEIKTLLNRNSKHQAQYIDRMKRQRIFNVHTDSAHDRPIDVVNEIFSIANLPVQFVLTGSGISALRGKGEPYSIENLSNGERASLYLAAAFTNRKSGSVILVDEPEKHLDQSISNLLIGACIRASSNISVIMSTHDPRLIDGLPGTRIIHLRNSTIASASPERRIYEVSEIGVDKDDIDHLRKDLMGVRNKVLFVEGEENSDDLALYSQIYPSIKVIPKGSWQTVCEATKGIGRLVDGHWLEPRGLIDGDGRSDEEKSALASDGIYTLPYPTIENLFFTETAISCFISADMKFRGGPSEVDRLTNLKRTVDQSVISEFEKIVALRVSWKLERILSGNKRSFRSIMSGERGEITIAVEGVYEETASEINTVIGNYSPEALLRHLPIKKTSVPHHAATALGADSFRHINAPYCVSLKSERKMPSMHWYSFVNYYLSFLKMMLS